jgi:hypothetical protein
MTPTIRFAAMTSFTANVAAVLFASFSFAEDSGQRSVVIGGESLHEEKSLDLLLDMARNLRFRPGLKARALYSAKTLVKEGEAAVQKAQADGATILNESLEVPWLSADGLQKVVPGEALAWVTMSVYGTAIELVAFVRDEKGRLLGICHRQASTRVIPGEGGRFDRVAPGPRQYLQNAAVELAADIVEVLRRDQPIAKADRLPVILPGTATDKNLAWIRSYLALFGRFSTEWAGFLPVLAQKGTGDQQTAAAPVPRLHVEISGGGEDAPEEVTLSILYHRPDGTKALFHSGKAPRDERHYLARMAVSQLFGEGDRILLAVPPPPPEDEKTKTAKKVEKPKADGPALELPELPPPSLVRIDGDSLVCGGDPKTPPKWSYPLPDSASSNLATRGDSVALGCRNGDVILLNSEDGQAAFRAELPDSVCLVRLVEGGSVFAADIDGNMCLFAGDGGVKWELKEKTAAAHCLDVDAATLGVVLADGCLAALAVADGKALWRCQLPERVGQPPVAYEGSLIVPGVSGRFYRVGVPDGKSTGFLMLQSPPAEPLRVVRKAKLPMATFRDKLVDVLYVRCVDGSAVVVSLTDVHRPTDVMDLSQEWEVLDEGTQ